MDWLKRLASSIVVRITALTLAAFTMMLIVVFALSQTPFLTKFLQPRALADNSVSIAELVWLLENSPKEIEPFILGAYEGGGRVAAIGPDFAEGLAPRDHFKSVLAQSDSDVASHLNDRDIRFETLGLSSLQTRLKQQHATPMRLAAALQVAIALKDGRVLNVWLAQALTLQRQPILLTSAGLLILLFSVALGLASAAVTLDPIRQLEQDAERVELGEAGAAVSETGPAELRRVSAALNRMRARLTALIREREQMVAAIAHDVRTGLTRIRLRMDERGEVSAEEIESDVAQMEALISDMLAYAHAETPSGQQELVRLESFVAEVAKSVPHPLDLDLSEGDDFVIAGVPVALRRLFENLIENARRYGGGKITVRVIAKDGGREVRIEDNGAGLPEDKLEAVFEPFYRGENSRNRATGGTGLGLGIARAIARAHGASLTLVNRPEGGLAAIVHFPRELGT